jgi:hypothetical protein
LSPPTYQHLTLINYGQIVRDHLNNSPYICGVIKHKTYDKNEHELREINT